MVTVYLTGRMSVEPILPIRWTVSIGTIVKFDGDKDSDGVRMCKQAFTLHTQCRAAVAETVPYLLCVAQTVMASSPKPPPMFADTSADMWIKKA